MGACVSYQDFLDKKKLQPVISGFKAESLNDNLFDFQRVIVEWALRRGRAAIFADTGLGKTLMQTSLKPSYFDQAVKNMEDADRYNHDLFA